jgi:hypothetical protein
MLTHISHINLVMVTNGSIGLNCKTFANKQMILSIFLLMIPVLQDVLCCLCSRDDLQVSTSVGVGRPVRPGHGVGLPGPFVKSLVW